MTSTTNPTLPDELFALAQKVAADHAKLPKLEAILLTGSVAKGWTDAVSDIDLMFYYAELPNHAEFERLKQAALDSGGDIYSYTPGEALACYHFIDGIKVDFAHQVSAEIEMMVDEFLANAIVDNETTHIIMSGIAQGILLFGGEKVQQWQQRLSAPSERYWASLICNNLRFPPVAVMKEMGAERQDYALVYELMLQSLPRLINIWCGLSGKIPPGKVKSSDRLASTLGTAPDNAGARLRQMWNACPEDGVTIFYQLVDETLLLVEKHHPQIDTRPARERLQLKLQKR